MMLIQVAPGQSLQTVIDALPADDQPVTIHLAPGVYEEKIALRRPHTRIEGESAETTRITWHDGAAEILPDGKKRGTFRTATLLINARDCALRNVTVENSAYPREQVGQALALYVDGDGFHCEDCTLKSARIRCSPRPCRPVKSRRTASLARRSSCRASRKGRSTVIAASRAISTSSSAARRRGSRTATS